MFAMILIGVDGGENDMGFVQHKSITISWVGKDLTCSRQDG